MNLPRRRFLHLAACAPALPAVSRLAWAQAYPTRPVRIVVGYPAGGGTDIFVRLVGQPLSERLGQSLVIENRPGAASNIATEAVVRAPADGYTLLGSDAAAAINATMYEKLNFNFIRDIAPVGIIRGPLFLIVHPSVPANTVPEFIAYAKANPGKVSMASAGSGNATHLAGELFKVMTHIDMTHVPYRGAGPAVDRPARRPGAGLFRQPAGDDRAYPGRQASHAGGDDRDALRDIARRPDRGRVRAGLRGEPVVRGRLAQEQRPPRSSTSSTARSTSSLRTPR